MSVDIIVPVYGGAEHLNRCGVSLVRTLGDREDVKVFVVDDCTPEHLSGGLSVVYENMAGARMFEICRTPRNSGYAATNNYGATLGSADYMCLLNSDTQPQPGWLAAMENILDNMPSVGIVGARLLFPPWIKEDRLREAGRVQHAGVAFNADRMPYHIFLGWSADHPRVKKTRLMKAVTGACWLLRRAVYEDIGGLDPAYTTGNFEDIDFCLKAVGAGYDILYCPGALLWHYASGSNNTATAEKNAALFRSRWYDLLECDEHLYY